MGLTISRRRMEAGLLLAWLFFFPAVLPALVDRAPPCVVRTTLGIPCPGCGLGRSLQALSRLELGRAIRLYPPLPLLAAAYLALLGAAASATTGRRVPHQGRVILGAGLALVVTGNWLVNLMSQGGTP